MLKAYLNAYERQLILFYLSNAADRLHHGRLEARALADWFDQNLDLLELRDESEKPGKGPKLKWEEGWASKRTRNESKMSAWEWQHVQELLAYQHSAASEGGREDRTARRLRSLGREMDLAQEDVAILEIMLRERTQPIIESLLYAATPGELEWSDFDHVAEERDYIEKLVKGALSTGAPGVNILVYGPPGTGKTEFCKTLAAQLGANLYSVGEEDDDGRDPKRHERLQELRLAECLLDPSRLTTLTPGDFAVVRRKAEILGHLQDAKALAELLCAECEAKPNHSHKMGF